MHKWTDACSAARKIHVEYGVGFALHTIHSGKPHPADQLQREFALPASNRTRTGIAENVFALQPAKSAESQDGLRIQSALQQLGASPDSRLTLLEVISRRAERAGLGNVHVALLPPDSVPQIPREGAPPVTIKVADYGILVEFKGSFAATRTFLASLPPTVGVQRLTISRSGPATGTRAVLTVYEAVVDGPS